MPTNRIQKAILPAALVLFAALVQSAAGPGGAHVERRRLQDFPVSVAVWEQQGAPERFDPQTEEILSADDYTQREFAGPGQHRVGLFVAYYHTTLNVNKDFHSPLVCLPGSGWNMTPQPKVRIVPRGGGPPFEANYNVVSKRDQEMVVLHWYQGRGRFVTGELWNKAYSLFDSISQRRSDGAIVRVTAPVRGSREAALAEAREFAAQAVPQLTPFIPQ